MQTVLISELYVFMLARKSLLVNAFCTDFKTLFYEVFICTKFIAS
uniref:Uncharacterized protein n=1 Tax=Siphoviridae sp. ctD6g5 TaxID=2826196 RepID=A0A8S5MRR8_9CAUD|nr:MAG TPA: hypothetical protein [Siphoviridae sp. ctD6g5]